MTRLEKFYRDTVKAQLQEQFKFDSAMQIPKVTKITLNIALATDAAARASTPIFPTMILSTTDMSSCPS